MSDRLTAMEIEKQVFTKKVRGYDPEEVRLYLRSVAEEIERLTLDNGNRQEELGRLRAELDELRGRDKTLQQTLVTAQQMSESVKQQAHAEADLLIKEARHRSDVLLQESREQLARMEADISRSKMERESFERRLKNVIDQHLTLLELRQQARGDIDNLRVLPQRVGNDAG